MKDLTASQTNPFKVIVLTETWLADEKSHKNSFFPPILNSALIPQIRKCSRKGCSVVVYIHKSVNYKIIHDLRWLVWLV